MILTRRILLAISVSAAFGLLGRSSAQAQMTIVKNFRGTVYGAGNDSIPPDTMGAVGDNHFVEFINGGYKAFDKNTGNRVQSMTDTEFWDNANVPADNLPLSDTRVLYDRASKLWYASAIDIPYDTSTFDAQPNQFLIAVSNTSDPTQGWHGASVEVDNGVNGYFGDFPTLGINGKSVYIAADLYEGVNLLDENSGAIQHGETMVAINKTDLINDNVDDSSITRFDNMDRNTVGTTLQAVQDLDGGTDDEMIVSNDPGDTGPSNRLFVDRISNEQTDSAIFQNVLTNTVNAYTAPPQARQKGGNPIDTNDARFSSAVTRVGNSLWGVHSTTIDGRAGVRWYQIDAKSGKVLQQGDIGNANLDYYFPSIAVNKDGTAVIGFTGSGDNQYASSYAIMGRTSGGVTRFGDALLLKAGAANYNANPDDNRWGDYSATTLDPNDSNLFWTEQEVAYSTDHWATQITAIRVAAVPEMPVSIGMALGMGGMLSLVRLRRRKR